MTGVMLHEKQDIESVVFKKGDLLGNYKKLLVFAYILTDVHADIAGVEAEIGKLVPHYEIISKWGDMNVVVGPGHYESAALLYFLAAVHGCKDFRLTSQDQEIILLFYSDEILADAIQSPETKYKTVRALLSPEAHVKLSRK